MLHGIHGPKLHPRITVEQKRLSICPCCLHLALIHRETLHVLILTFSKWLACLTSFSTQITEDELRKVSIVRMMKRKSILRRHQQSVQKARYTLTLALKFKFSRTYMVVSTPTWLVY